MIYQIFYHCSDCGNAECPDVWWGGRNSVGL